MVSKTFFLLEVVATALTDCIICRCFFLIEDEAKAPNKTANNGIYESSYWNDCRKHIDQLYNYFN